MAPNDDDGSKRAGWKRRRLLVGIGAGLVMITAGVVAAVLLAGGGKRSATPATTRATQKESSYAGRLRSPIRQLEKSATVMGRALTTLARATQIKSLRETASSQLTVVQRLRTQLAGITPDAGKRTLHARLLTAVANHRRYLALLVRATSLPTKDGLGALDRLRSTVRLAFQEYRVFFNAEPTLPNLIRGSGMDDLTGFRRALRSKLARSTPPATPPPTSPPPIASFPPSYYTGPFAAVDGLEQCYAQNDYVTCGATPSGKQASLYAGDGAYYDGTGEVTGDGAHMPEGTSFTTNTGDLRCGSSSRGITCTDLTGTGAYFIIGDYYVIVANNGTETRH